LQYWETVLCNYYPLNGYHQIVLYRQDQCLGIYHEESNKGLTKLNVLQGAAICWVNALMLKLGPCEVGLLLFHSFFWLCEAQPNVIMDLHKSCPSPSRQSAKQQTQGNKHCRVGNQEACCKQPAQPKVGGHVALHQKAITQKLMRTFPPQQMKQNGFLPLTEGFWVGCSHFGIQRESLSNPRPVPVAQDTFLSTVHCHVIGITFQSQCWHPPSAPA